MSTKNSIVEKLNNYIRSRQKFQEESDVVYCLIQMRKIVEDVDGNEFKLIRFYADWVAHTSKDRNMPVIKEYLEKIDESVQSVSSNPAVKNLKPHVDFVEFRHLKSEIQDFFSKHVINDCLVNQYYYWESFADILRQVLADVPLKNPTKNIKAFKIVYSGKRMYLWSVEFNDQRGDWTLGIQTTTQ